MFVSIAEVFENLKPMAAETRSELIRLMPLDDCQHGSARDALYLSVVSGQMVFGGGSIRRYWELGTPVGRPTINRNQRTDDVIKTGPNLLDGLGRDDAQSFRNSATVAELPKRLLRIRILADNGSLRCFVKEDFGFEPELIDVLGAPR